MTQRGKGRLPVKVSGKLQQPERELVAQSGTREEKQNEEDSNFDSEEGSDEDEDGDEGEDENEDEDEDGDEDEQGNEDSELATSESDCILYFCILHFVFVSHIHIGLSLTLSLPFTLKTEDIDVMLPLLCCGVYCCVSHG